MAQTPFSGNRQPPLDNRSVPCYHGTMRNTVMLLVCLASAAYADFPAGLRSYEKGDYVSALKEWLPLAEQGDAVSQNNVGTMYQHGRGTPQDYGLAAKWYQKAADQGLAAAQNNLGFCYLRGHGVSQDYLQAQMWFTLAGPGKDQEDLDARAELARLLTPNQVSQALELAQAWRARTAISRAVSGPRQLVMWQYDQPTTSGRFLARGRVYKSIRMDSVSVTAAIEPERDLVRCSVGIKNSSAVSVDILTKNISIVVGQRHLAPLGVNVLARKGSKGHALMLALAGGLAGYLDVAVPDRTTGTVTDSNGNRYDVELDQRTNRRQQEVLAQAETVRRQQAERERSIKLGALQSTTVLSGARYAGFVFFPALRKADPTYVSIEVTIGRNTFRIPFDLSKAPDEY